jgi:invasion protein IalB
MALGAGLAVYAAPADAASSSHTDLAQYPQEADLQPHTAEPVQTEQPSSKFPRGASSVKENYWDWQVFCELQGTAKRCVLTQQQMQKDGQRVLAIQIAAPTSERLSGIMVLPFGLALAPGVSLQVDDRPAGSALPFRTCLPAGCMVTMSFDGPTVTMLRTGMALRVRATVDSGQETLFSVSLAGFSAGLDRIAELSR